VVSYLIWGIVAVLVVATVVWGMWRHRLPKYEDMEFEEVDDLLQWLADYEAWYERSSGLLHEILIVCRVLPIGLGFLVAIVSALDDKLFQAFIIPKNIVVIILTGLSTICVAIITQLGLADLARTREAGRIAFSDMRAKVKLLIAAKGGSSKTNPKALVEDFEKIAAEVFKIEREQADRFVLITTPGEKKDPKR
jgi:hypothetical protein